MNHKQKILDKIRKLRSLANDAHGNQHECEAAAARMARLMFKERITEAELGDENPSQAVFLLVHPSKKAARWWIHMLAGVAKMNGCLAIRGRRTMPGLWVYGPEERGVLVKHCFSWLLVEINLCWTGYPKDGFRHTKQDFCLGVSDRCQARMQAQQQEVREEAEKHVSSCQALVIIDQQDKQVQEDFVKLHESTGGKAKSEEIVFQPDYRSYAAGWIKGADVGLPLLSSRTVETSKARKSLT